MEKLDSWFREQVKASSGSKKQCGGAAAQLKVLPQVISQVHPSDGLSKPDHCSLRPIQLTMMMVVVVVMGLIMVMMMMMMVVVVVISDAADSEIGGIERKEGFMTDDEGREKKGLNLKELTRPSGRQRMGDSQR